MCRNQGSWVSQFVMPPHPKREEDNSSQANDWNQ